MNKHMIYGVCKYKNIMGITCYMNSILHILQQLPYFTIFIYDMMFEKNLKKKLLSSNNSDIQKYLIYQLYKLFKLSLDNDDSVITPYGFKQFICTKNSIWSELNQQDSEEFFSFLISLLGVKLKGLFTALPSLPSVP